MKELVNIDATCEKDPNILDVYKKQCHFFESVNADIARNGAKYKAMCHCNGVDSEINIVAIDWSPHGFEVRIDDGKNMYPTVSGDYVKQIVKLDENGNIVVK